MRLVSTIGFCVLACIVGVVALRSSKVAPDALLNNVISIHIEDDDYQELERQRNRAMQSAYITQEFKTKAPARVAYKGKVFPANIRLKGDAKDHINTSKWSLRIEMENGYIEGMDTFSLQHPKTRNWLVEAIWHEALRREGVVALRFFYVPVVINNEYKGIYAFEEHFDDELLVFHDRTPAPIIRFDESVLWKQRAEGSNALTSKELYKTSTIDSFDTKRIEEDPLLSEQFAFAKQALDGVRDRTHGTEVIDAELFAKYFAISDLFGARHSRYWHNLRFYWNPNTSLLEPIAFDGSGSEKSEAVEPIVFKQGGAFESSISRDEQFYGTYIQELQRVTEEGYLERVLEDISPLIEEWLSVLQTEYPDLTYSDEDFIQNRETVRAFLNENI